jgi:hypothetical protein
MEHLAKAKVVKTMPVESKKPENDLADLKEALGI